MTVRANKPAFSIREKLKELDYAHVPYDKMPAGSVIQVVQSTSEDISTQSGTGQKETPLTLTISPKFSNSKIFVQFDGFTFIDQISSNNDVQAGFFLRRKLGGVDTSITKDNVITQRFVGDTQVYWDMGANTSMTKLDSPNTIQEITYVFCINVVSSSALGQLNNNFSGTNTQSHLTAFEINQ